MRKKQDIMWEQSTLITKQIQAIKMEFPKPEFHFSADGHNAFTESIAPQSLRFAASEI